MAIVENLSRMLTCAPVIVCLSWLLHSARVPWRVILLVVLVSLCVSNYVHRKQCSWMVLANWNLADGSTWHGRYTAILQLGSMFDPQSRACGWLQSHARHMSLAMHLLARPKTLSNLMEIHHPSWCGVDCPSMAIVYF